MRNLWTIVKREFKTRVATKGFVIGTILTPLLLGVIMSVPTILMRMDSEKQFKILVSDPADIAFDNLVIMLDDTLQNGKQKFVWTRDNDASGASDEIKKALEEEIYEGFVFLDPTLSDSGEIVYYSKNTSPDK